HLPDRRREWPVRGWRRPPSQQLQRVPPLCVLGSHILSSSRPAFIGRALLALLYLSLSLYLPPPIAAALSILAPALAHPCSAFLEIEPTDKVAVVDALGYWTEEQSSLPQQPEGTLSESRFVSLSSFSAAHITRNGDRDDHALKHELPEHGFSHSILCPGVT